MIHLVLPMVVAITLLVPGPPDGTADAPTVLNFSPLVRVKARTVELGDIASITGPEETVRALETVGLGLAPAPGFRSTLTLRAVAETLHSRGFALDGLRLIGPRTIAVQAEVHTVSGATIADGALRFVRGELPARPGEELEIRPVYTPADVVVRPGRMGVRIDYRWRSRRHTGRNVICDALVLVDGERHQSVSVALDVQILREVLVTAEPVQRGEPLGADRVVLARRDVTAFRGTPLGRPEDIGGRALRRGYAVDAVIFEEDLYAPPVVERGDSVIMQVVSGRLNVRALGTAQADGAIGDTIQVLNTSTGRTVIGRVVARGLIEISIGGVQNP